MARLRDYHKIINLHAWEVIYSTECLVFFYLFLVSESLTLNSSNDGNLTIPISLLRILWGSSSPIGRKSLSLWPLLLGLNFHLEQLCSLCSMIALQLREDGDCHNPSTSPLWKAKYPLILQPTAHSRKGESIGPSEYLSKSLPFTYQALW